MFLLFCVFVLLCVYDLFCVLCLCHILVGLCFCFALVVLCFCLIICFILYICYVLFVFVLFCVLVMVCFVVFVLLCVCFALCFFIYVFCFLLLSQSRSSSGRDCALSNSSSGRTILQTGVCIQRQPTVSAVSFNHLREHCLNMVCLMKLNLQNRHVSRRPLSVCREQKAIILNQIVIFGRDLVSHIIV